MPLLQTLHPSHRPSMRAAACGLVPLLLGTIIISLFPFSPEQQQVSHYLPLHTILEIMSVVAAAVVFSTGWSAYQRGLAGNVYLLAFTFLAIAMFDCLHLLSYTGMPDFVTPNHPEKAINFWLAARTLAAIVLLVVASTHWQPLSTPLPRIRILLLMVTTVVASSYVLIVHEEYLPRTFITGKGLTPLTIAYEYVLMGLYLCTALLLWYRMRKPQPFNAPMLFSTAISMALAEFLLTLYSEVNDIYILAGHVCKLAGYLCLYRAIFIDAIEHPYQLADSRQKDIQFLADHVPVFIAQYDTQKCYRFINRSYADALGVKVEETLGKHARQLLGKETYRQASPYMDRALAGQPCSFEVTLDTLHHGQRTFLVRHEPERNARAQIIGFIAAVSDITRLKRSEEQMRQTSDFLQSIMQHVPVRIFWKDTQLHYLGGNHLFARDANIDHPAALVGKSDRDMPWSEQSERFRRDDMNVIQSGQSLLDIEEPQQQPDGSTHWRLASKVPMRDPQNNIIGVLGVYQDITSLKRAEIELRNLSLAVEQSPNFIIITDLDGFIEYVNQSFVEITGYRREEVMGRNPRFLQSERTPPSVFTDMWQHLRDGKTWRGELINKGKTGEEFVSMALVSPVRQADGQIMHYLSIQENITEYKRAEARIEKLAHFDQLTGLPNRSLLRQRFDYAFGMARRHRDPLAIMFLDLDHFKNINDSLGHSIGDEVLVQIAHRIKDNLRQEDTVSRQGGDEFMLVLPDTSVNGASHVAQKLIEAISRPCHVQQHELIITPSIGIAIYPENGSDFETLSRNADAAMYRVKRSGRQNFCFFTPEMQASSTRSLLLDSALRHALDRNELQLNYQPQLSLHNGKVVGVEALLRWHNPELGKVSPAEFIAIAEENGQINRIGAWVIRTAARQLRQWLDKGMDELVMAVNLSAVQFRQANISELITGILDEEGIPYHLLELELTEAVAMGDPKTAIEVMNKLHQQGIRMSIDDFGTGYSSLSYLKQFRVSKLKIDQSFVRDISEDPEDKAIVSAIIHMAASLGIKTVAEGVETSAQLSFLRLQGCDQVQGYYFSKPLPADEFKHYVQSSTQNS